MILGFLRVLFGFVIACVAAALVQLLFAFGPNDYSANRPGGLELVFLTATHFAVFSSVFALLVAALGEYASIRNWYYYAVAGLGIAMAGFLAQYSSETTGSPTILNDYAVKAFLAPGIAGGLVYWLFAGRLSGLNPHETVPRITVNGS